MAAGDVKGELNAEEIFELENQSAAITAADAALTVALNFHANRRSLLQRDYEKFWKHLADRLGFTASTEIAHAIERRDGTTVVVETTRESIESDLVIGRKIL